MESSSPLICQTACNMWPVTCQRGGNTPVAQHARRRHHGCCIAAKIFATPTLMSRPCIVCPTPREVPCCLLSPRQSFRRPGVSQNSRQMLLFRDPVSKQLYGSSQRSIHVKHQYKSNINRRQRSIHVKHQYKSKINTCQTSIQVKDQYKSNINTRQSFFV